MKTRLNLWVALWFVPFFAQAQDRVTLQNYTLKQCITYALEHDKMLANANLDVAIAKAQVGEYRAIGLPQINGNIGVDYIYKIPSGFFPAGFVAGFDPSIQARIDNGSLAGDALIPFKSPFQPPLTSQAGVSLSQLLFDGSYFVGLRASKALVELSQKSTNINKSDLAANVSKAYYGLLVNQERANLLDVNLQRLTNLLKETKAMYDNGLIEKIDVDRLEVNFNNLSIEKQKLQRLIALSAGLLKFQMGLNVQDQLTIADNLRTIQVELANISAETLMNYNQRPEYSVLETQKYLENLNLQNIKAGYLPKVSLLWSYGFNTGTRTTANLFRFNKDYWRGTGTVGINVSIPIFDGFRKMNVAQKSRINIQKIENTMSNLKRIIDLETSQASIMLTNSVESLTAQKKNMEIAAEVLRVTKIKYQEGVGSNLEVLNAEAAYKDSETNYYASLYDALIAKVDLQKATGKILEN